MGLFRYSDNPRRLIESLYDDISIDKLELDMIDFSGPAFEYVDNRLMSLQLVKMGMTDAVIFNSEGNNTPYRYPVQTEYFCGRGSFRPVTLVNVDMFENGLKMFLEDNNTTIEDTEVLFRLRLNLRAARGYRRT